MYYRRFVFFTVINLTDFIQISAGNNFNQDVPSATKIPRFPQSLKIRGCHLTSLLFSCRFALSSLPEAVLSARWSRRRPRSPSVPSGGTLQQSAAPPLCRHRDTPERNHSSPSGLDSEQNGGARLAERITENRLKMIAE